MRVGVKLYRSKTVVGISLENSKKRGEIDFSQSGNQMVVFSGTDIFHVNVKDPWREGCNDFLRVFTQHVAVPQIEVRSKATRAHHLNKSPKLFASLHEQSGLILDADPDARVFRMLKDRLKRFSEEVPSLLNAVSRDHSARRDADIWGAQKLGKVDAPLLVVYPPLPCRPIWVGQGRLKERLPKRSAVISHGSVGIEVGNAYAASI